MSSRPSDACAGRALRAQAGCPGASAEECAAIRGELLERVEEAFFRHDFQMSGAFAAGKNDAVQIRRDPPGGGQTRARRPDDRASWRGLRNLPEWPECRFSCQFKRHYDRDNAIYGPSSAITSRGSAADPSPRAGGRRGPSWLRRVLRRLRGRFSRHCNAWWPSRWLGRAARDRST